MSVTSETIAQAADAPPLHTRGDLTVDFLTSNADPAAHLAQLGQKPDNYGGYNMVCVDLARQEAWALSNRGDRAVTPLASGLHAMSNGVPQDQWPKMATGMARLQPLLDSIAPDGTQPRYTSTGYANRIGCWHCQWHVPRYLMYLMTHES